MFSNNKNFNSFYNYLRLIVVTPVTKWIYTSAFRGHKNFILAFVLNHIIIYYGTPVNLTYSWSFWSLAGVCLVIQIISGLFMLIVIRKNISVAFMSIKSLLLVINFIFAFVSSHIINSSAQKLIFVSYTLKKFIKFLSNFKKSYLKITAENVELVKIFIFSIFAAVILCAILLTALHYYFIYCPICEQLVLIKNIEALAINTNSKIPSVLTHLIDVEKIVQIAQNSSKNGTLHQIMSPKLFTTVSFGCLGYILYIFGTLIEMAHAINS